MAASRATYNPETGMNTFSRATEPAATTAPAAPWRPTLAPQTTYAPAQAAGPQYNATTNLGQGYDPNSAWAAHALPTQQQAGPTNLERAQVRDTAPQNPREAMDYQFYGAQDAQRRQEEMFNQMMEAFSRAQEAQSGAFQESQQRNEGLMREGLGVQRQDYTQATQRNEGVMREGIEAQQAEAARVAAQNQAMMRQKQATLQHYFSLLSQGGEGSLAAITSPIASQMAESWNMGMEGATNLGGFYQGMQAGPMQSGSYYQGMMGGMDPSSQYLGQMGQAAGQTQLGVPDYSLWMDPEAYRTGWVLPGQTMGLGDSFFGANQTGANSRMTNVGY